MTKLLYVPSGEYIQFLKVPSQTKTIEYTTTWEESQWYIVWEESIEDVIIQFCKPEAEITTKVKHNIPTNVHLVPREFEIIKE